MNKSRDFRTAISVLDTEKLARTVPIVAGLPGCLVVRLPDCTNQAGASHIAKYTLSNQYFQIYVIHILYPLLYFVAF